MRDLMHEAQCVAEHLDIVIDRIHRVRGKREVRSARDDVQPPGIEIWPDDAQRKISRTAVLQDVLQAEPPDIGSQRGAAEIGKADIVTRIEFRAPFDIDIARLRFGCTARV